MLANGNVRPITQLRGGLTIVSPARADPRPCSMSDVRISVGNGAMIAVAEILHERASPAGNEDRLFLCVGDVSAVHDLAFQLL